VFDSFLKKCYLNASFSELAANSSIFNYLHILSISITDKQLSINPS
jgi:hypothetical protein